MHVQWIGPVENLVRWIGPRRRNGPLASAPLALARYSGKFFFLGKVFRYDVPKMESIKECNKESVWMVDGVSFIDYVFCYFPRVRSPFGSIWQPVPKMASYGCILLQYDFLHLKHL